MSQAPTKPLQTTNPLQKRTAKSKISIMLELDHLGRPTNILSRPDRETDLLTDTDYALFASASPEAYTSQGIYKKTKDVAIESSRDETPHRQLVYEKQE